VNQSSVAAAPAGRVAVVEVAAAPAPLDAVMHELRAAIRGQPADALAATLDTSLESIRAACGQLIQQGQVVRRGHKYFVA